MTRARYAIDWLVDGLPLRVLEPTPEEVRPHAEALAVFYNDPVNRALLTNEHDFEADDVVEQFRDMQSEGDRPFLMFAQGSLVGDCDLRHVEADRAEYAVLVGARATQAKGLGTKLTKMVLSLAFGPLQMAYNFAAIRPDNHGSLRMFEKLGYVIDTSPAARRYAEADDDVCVSITREAFLERHVDTAAVRIGER